MSSFLPFLRLETNQPRKLETIDRNSLLRIGRTVRVSSFDEMRHFLDFPQDYAFPGTAEVGLVDNLTVSYIFYASPLKPLADFSSSSAINFTAAVPLRVAVSTFATKELLESGAEEQIRAHLESIVDSYEAAILHAILTSLSFNAGTSISFDNYRDIFSRLVAFAMDLEAGTENVYIHIPTSFIYGSLYEVDVANTNVSATTRPEASAQWWQNERFFDTSIKFVKVPLNTNSFLLARTAILAYTDFLVKSFVRYVLDDFHVERVSVSGEERNLYRLTLERYFVHNIPILRTNASSRSLLGTNEVTACVGVLQVATIGTIPNSHPNYFVPLDLANIINRIS